MPDTPSNPHPRDCEPGSPSGLNADQVQPLDGFATKAADAQRALQPLHLIDEISHRVVNEYTEAICALGRATAAARSRQARIALSTAAARLRAQAEAHRALQAPIFEGPMDLAEYAGRVCASLAAGPLDGRGVRLSLQTDEIWLSADRCWRVGLILAELIRNAARHGLVGGPGRIWVAIGETAGRICCEVRDDGRGRPGASGRGRRLVQALAADLGGSAAWVFTPTGCSARLIFAAPSALAARQRLVGRAATSLFDSPSP